MNFVQITVTSCWITFPDHSPISSVVYFIVRDSVHQLKIIQNDFADIMKKEHVIASKKMKTITKPKTVIDLGEDLPIFSAVSNVDLENLYLSITANIKDLLAPLTQQIRELRDFLNFQTKCIDQKLNFDKTFLILYVTKIQQLKMSF